MSGRWDPHVHSTASDGTDAPAELVRQAAAAGLDGIVLTDHDTTAGWAEARAAGQRHGIAVRCGIEVSACVPRAGERPVSVHLLAYELDGDPGAGPGATVQELLEATVGGRARRMDRMAELVAADHGVGVEEVWAHVPPGATPGRPHVADALVALGAVADRDEAFATVLGPGGRYNLPHPVPTVDEVIPAVRTAGGVVVLAHPLAGRRGRVVVREEVEQMVELGLAGLEVHHRDHDAGERVLAARWADAYELVPTGASDFHGDGKPNRLAENTTGADELEELWRRRG